MEKTTTRLCNEDCNHCEAIRNRQVSLALYVLRGVFGEVVTGIVNDVCPNLTCCADCHIDDFCHARKWRRILRRRNVAAAK